jgi:hypothetical protein
MSDRLVTEKQIESILREGYYTWRDKLKTSDLLKLMANQVYALINGIRD